MMKSCSTMKAVFLLCITNLQQQRCQQQRCQQAAAAAGSIGTGEMQAEQWREVNQAAPHPLQRPAQRCHTAQGPPTRSTRSTHRLMTLAARMRCSESRYAEGSSMR